MVKIIGIVGNNSTKSTNRTLMQYIARRYKEQAEIDLFEVRDLPMFNKPSNGQIPEKAKEIAAKIEVADGVIISTPEYDLSIPAALSSALAWLSYNIYPFVDKPVMIVGASYGALGSSRAQQHLRSILNAPVIRAIVMPGNEFLLGHSLQAFDENGDLIFPEKVKQLDGYFVDFLKFIRVTEVLSSSHESNVQEAANFYADQFDLQAQRSEKR
ncbi:NAD(P)H-dependent oxidoreductase [Facklamia sp. DSM 111018]|uniref:NAD(P)H-dependent oxidoreductase n=1 Tax=Facklamia lactis TaxID=2749967 RepID=A0ABS0LP87_9LACT|nr:NADPH-dependent FMN reductase [Facklamia lactis]MBG9980174.1 NAD(P)H-dependent oxidoreductase [Facklamia lactis]MBG9985976.1 NAD(P)H-dependent oxidoreductase [Facklamia lactis]